MIYLEIYVVVLVIALLLMMKIDISTKKYKTITNKKDLSGFEIARDVLDDSKLTKTYIIEKKGKTVDFYDYKNKVVKLSSLVFHEDSLYALAIGCYIGMHGSYDKKEDSLYKFVGSFLPIIKVVYYISLFLIVAGMCVGNEAAYQLALLLLIVVIIFSVILFVVKKKIAYSAYDYLVDNKIIKKDEEDGISNVLSNVYFESFTWLITDLICGLVNLLNQNK